MNLHERKIEWSLVQRVGPVRPLHKKVEPRVAQRFHDAVKEPVL